MVERGPRQPHLIVPLGTRVVTRVEVRADGERGHRPVGSVAEVVGVPADALHRYRVRFVDGAEASLRRKDLSLLGHYKSDEAGLPHPLSEQELSPFIIYRCVVGSRAYGLSGPDSDVDRRGFYLPPADLHWSLHGVPAQLENEATQECYWELQKFLDLALRANPNVLECLYTPLVEHATPLALELLAMRGCFLSKLASVHTTPEHEELKALVPGCLTRHHRHHYRGFAETQWALFKKESQPRVKPLLYVYRVLLTGIHLLRTGQVEANLVALNEEWRLPYLAELIERKVTGTEKGVVPALEVGFHEREVARFVDLLEEAAAKSALPEAPSARAALHDLLVRVRLRGLSRTGGA